MNEKTQPSSSKAANVAETSQNHVPHSNGNEVGNNSQFANGNGRNGLNTGRGGYSYRGRGGMSGRGNYGGTYLNSERKYSVVNNGEKGKNVVSEVTENQKKGNVKAKPKEPQVKHIAQKKFTTKNRFAALASEEEEDVQNEIEGIKIKIDVSCEMGIDISSEERDKWPKDLQDYYEQKCSFMGKMEKIEKLKKKIIKLSNDINSRSKSIEAKVTEEANDMVAEEMESTGVSRDQAFSKVYNEFYSKESKEIQKLNLRKQLADVELFIVSKKPSSEIPTKGWTKEMVEFYDVRVAELSKSGMVNDAVMVDEVGNDSTAHADFIVQNNVSSPADAAMASVLGNVDAGPSSLVK